MNENTQDLQNFLGIVPKQWPILDSSLTDLQIIERTRTGLFSMSVLNTVKNRQAISAQQWREIGNNQKSLYRNQLLKRTGHASNAITDPPFEFDDLDFKNIFQIEAITEFYANYTDPWRGGEQVEGENLPREQLLSDGSLNPNYVKIDFLSPKGSSATGNGNIITLDLYDSTILDRVSPDSSNGDIIYFENDTNQSRPSHQYRIVSINKATQTVILDASPSFLNGTSSWEISLRPVLVIIDSFGGRISGSKATQNNPSNLQQLFLDGLPNPSKINPKFDTIYLYSDTGRPSKTYRIQSIDNSAHVITVDTAPQLNGAESFWNLQAGLSGVLPGTEGNLMSLENDGYDHYDACLFVVWDGQIQERYRWTSYTSHAGTCEALSSIRGNKKYSFYSEKAATKDFINYAFLLENTNSSAFYFEDPPRNDPNGKTGVMIHKGTNNATSAHRGTGSAGCLVSPSFEQCRDRMILFYQDEQRAITQANDSQVQLIYGLTSQIFTADKTAKKPIFQAIAWRNKIKGAIWVIRPEEIPV